jgi:dTDP-glucose 4,6-dehydratase
MQVLVTGGAGFIGSHFVRRLLEQGNPIGSDRVVVLDKLTYAGNLANLGSHVDSPRVEFVKGDICDGELLDALLPGIDAVVNFAAETHVDRSIVGPQDFAVTNVLGAQVLFDACLRHQVERVTHIGTDEVYGSIDSGSWVESDPLLPNSPYSASKAGAELLARAYHQTYGLNICTTRCSNNYGAYQHVEKMIPLFITNLIDGRKVPLYGDGLNVRDWLHVEDHCQGIEVVMLHGEPGRSYNIGGGTELTNRELTQRLLDAMGHEWDMVEHVEDRKGHDRRYSLDDHLVRDLGYVPRRSFDSGLAETIVWYQDNESWWRSSKGDPTQA